MTGQPTRDQAIDQAAAAYAQVLRDMRRNGTLPKPTSRRSDAAPPVERAA
jgi:hypothetical protein